MLLSHRCRQFCRAIRRWKEVRQAVSTHLSLLEEQSLVPLGGLADEEERAVIGLVRASSSRPGPVIEFGTLFGLTTRLLAEHAAPGHPVITVDNFSWNPFGLPSAVHEAFTRKLLRSEIESGRVDLRAIASEAFRRGYDGPMPAMVFFDADHTHAAVRDEIAWAVGLGVPCIAGHDYGNRRFGVTRAVDEAFPGGVEVHGMVWAWKSSA